MSTVSRRHWLQYGIAGAATAIAAPCFAPNVGRAAAAQERWTMRLSTSSQHFSALPVEKACERIAALGFEAIDLWNEIFGCRHLIDAQTRLGPTGLKDLLARHKLKLSAMSCFCLGYPKYAQLLGDAGGGVAICESRDGRPKDLVPEMKAFLEQLKPKIELAEKHNSYIAIENHADVLLDSLDSLKAFADLNRSSRIGVALAPYHLQRSGIRTEEAIAALGKQLFFFYAWLHGEGTSQLPGHGPTDCRPWLAALAKTGYQGCVNLFMHGNVPPEKMAAALAASRDYLKKCYREAILR